MFQTICDKCKKPIGQKDEKLKIDYRRKGKFTSDSVDLCGKCAKLFMKLLPKFIPAEEE